MKINEIIKNLRLKKNWSQREIAEKLNLSVNGYSKIERGETQINTERLEELADIFEVRIEELLPRKEEALPKVYFIQGDHNQGNNFYNAPQEIKAEIETLKLIIKHKDELLEQQKREINQLQKLIELLQNK